MRLGTSYFVSKKHAVRYYWNYGYEDTALAIETKLAVGEIHIGKPTVEANQHLEIIDSGCRYCIVDN
jgi:hypothetical protein